MELILKLRYALWGPYTVLLIGLTGLLLTVRSRGVQFWCAGRLLRQSRTARSDGISPFQALCTSLGGTLGVGNLAGVASAISLGGPGAVLWMLLAAFLGMATKYSELLLAVKYRTRAGTPLGGPMVYLDKGAGLPHLARLFALCCVVSVLGTGAAAQGSAIAEALSPLVPLPRGLIGLLAGLCLLPVLYGGGKTIARVSSVLVPVMTAGYLLGGLAVLVTHADALPGAVHRIVAGAFEPMAAGGGLLGLVTARAVADGFAKGIFSNEAGMGSAPIAHGCADSDSPCAEGMLGAVEVFLDTCVVCLMTALVLLVTDAEQSGADGLQMTVTAFQTVLGPGAALFIGVTVVFLAASTILGWSFYGLACLRWLKAKHIVRVLYPLAVAASAGLAGCIPLTELLLVTDISAACMALPNLVGLWVLSDEVAAETDRFLEKKKDPR